MTDWPLMVTAILFLAAYSVQVLMIGPASDAASWFLAATWGLFVLDYVVSLLLAPQKGRWFLRNLHILAIVALPMLRPLRILRLVTLMSVLQRVAGNALRGRVVIYVIVSSALLVYVGALAMYDAEKGSAGASITSFGDALWWAIVTITTVGYGDLTPTTPLGRSIAVGLMIGGIALLGVVTATLASWLVEKVSAQEAQEVTSAEIQSLRDDIQMLRSELKRHGATSP